MTKFDDPYDNMTDDEFHAYVDRLRHREKSVSVTMRVPEPLLAEIKETAAAIGVPYQSLIKQWLADASAHFRENMPQQPKQGRPLQ